MTRVRVAAHVHSEWSYDGSWTLESLAVEFGRRGYDVVLMAEHDRGFDARRWSDYRSACAAVSSTRTLLVPGIEYSDAENVVHVLVWGELPFLGAGLRTADLLDEVDSQGGTAILAHPARRDALRKLDSDCLARFAGMELWNRKYDGYAPNRIAVEALRRRPDLVPMVGLDFHTRRQFHPLAMIMDVDGEPAVARIYDAVRARRARPTAFHLPALALTRGAAWPVIREVERVRRGAARRVRRARRLVRSRMRRDAGARSGRKLRRPGAE